MAGKKDQTTMIVLAIAGSLGVLSAILGFSAEGTKLTYVPSYRWGCYHRPNPALRLGVCAAIFLIISQVIFAVIGGWCGCRNFRAIPSQTNRRMGVLCAVISWILAVIAFALFVAGANSNGQGWRDRAGTYGDCGVPAGGIFAGGAVLTLAATALGCISYLLLRSQPVAAVAPNTGGGEQLPSAAAGPNTEGGEQLPAAAAVPNKAGGEQQLPSAAAVPNKGGGGQLPAAAAGIAIGKPQFPQQPRPEGYGQAPPPKFPQQPRPQGFGQAPPPKFLQKPRPPTPPKYPQHSSPGQGNNMEHVYEVELRVEGNPQPADQNGCGIADLPEEAQTSGGENSLSDLPEAEAYGVEHSLSNLPDEEEEAYGGYFDGVDFKF